jgi:hypothetical protein
LFAHGYIRRKYILKRIALWSAKLKSIVILSTVFLICILGYFFVLRSTIEKKEKIYLKFQFLKKQLNNQLVITSKYSNYEGKIKKSNQLDSCLQHENFWAGDSSKRINFLSIKKGNLPNILQMKINLSGTNKNIFKFINATVALNKFVLIKSFRWSFFKPLTKNLNQNIIISLRFYTCNYRKVILDLSKIKKLTAKSLVENGKLTKFSLDKIVMLGFLSAGEEQSWGFVRLPNKQICRVKLGDYLGLEQGLVVGIYATKIINLLNKPKKLFYVKNFI